MAFGLSRRIILVDRGKAVGVTVIAFLVLGCLLWNTYEAPISQFLRRIRPESVDWWARWLAYQTFTGTFRFGTAIIVLIGMGMTLSRIAWWRYVGIAALAGIGVGLQSRWIYVHYSLADWLQLDVWWVSTFVALAYSLLVAALAGFISRSRTVGLAVAIASLVPFGVRAWVILNVPVGPGGGRDGPGWQYLEWPACHAIIAAGVIAWSIRERRRNVSNHLCVFCGHDFGSELDRPCPECGGKPPVSR